MHRLKAQLIDIVSGESEMPKNSIILSETHAVQHTARRYTPTVSGRHPSHIIACYIATNLINNHRRPGGGSDSRAGDPMGAPARLGCSAGELVGEPAASCSAAAVCADMACGSADSRPMDRRTNGSSMGSVHFSMSSAVSHGHSHCVRAQEVESGCRQRVSGGSLRGTHLLFGADDQCLA